MDYATFLRDWLDHRGWSINRLAMEIGASQSLLTRWLHVDPQRRVRPSPRNLEKLAPVVGMPYEDLLRMCDYLPGAVQATPTDPELSAVMHAWPRLDPLRRGIIRDLVRDNARWQQLHRSRVAA